VQGTAASITAGVSFDYRRGNFTRPAFPLSHGALRAFSAAQEDVATWPRPDTEICMGNAREIRRNYKWKAQLPLSLSLSRRGDRRNLDEGRRKAKSQIRAPMDQVNQIARARNAWLADANGGVLGGLLLTYRIVRNERSRLPRGSRYAAMARKACIKDRSWALYWPIYMTVELITASQL